MKIKESYTLEELCSGLTMPLVKFCRMAGITEATLIRIRKGYSARQHTINSILAAFSKVYEIELDLSNVTGLTLQDKPHQTGKKPHLEEKMPYEMVQSEGPLLPIVEPKKRTWNQPKKKADYFPDGSIGIADFAKAHGVSYSTLYGHMLTGLDGGLVGMSTDTIPQNETIAYSERPKPNRPKEKERYLTPEQQAAALEFWRRHGIDFKMPEQEG